MTIASYRVKVGDMVEVKEKSKQLALVMEAQALAERDVPDYIDVDAGKLTAKMTRIPAIGDVPYAVQHGAASGGGILLALTCGRSRAPNPLPTRRGICYFAACPPSPAAR